MGNNLRRYNVRKGGTANPEKNRLSDKLYRKLKSFGEI